MWRPAVERRRRGGGGTGHAGAVSRDGLTVAWWGCRCMGASVMGL